MTDRPSAIGPTRREALIAERAERRRRHRALGAVDRDLRAMTHAELGRAIAAAAARSARSARRRRRPRCEEGPDLFDTHQESAA